MKIVSSVLIRISKQTYPATVARKFDSATSLIKSHRRIAEPPPVAQSRVVSSLFADIAVMPGASRSQVVGPNEPSPKTVVTDAFVRPTPALATKNLLPPRQVRIRGCEPTHENATSV